MRNHTIDPMLLNALALPLRRASRQRALARASDAATIITAIASLSFAAAKHAGAASWWIPLVAAAVLAFLSLRRGSLLTIAVELDRAAQTDELISSAWLMRQHLEDLWCRAIWSQATGRAVEVAARKKWHRLSAGTRTSMLLGSAAVCVVVSLAGTAVRPTPQRAAAAAAPSFAAESHSPDIWAVPPAQVRSTEEPEEAGRSVVGESDAPLKHLGDDSRGSGRADAAGQGEHRNTPFRSTAGEPETNSRAFSGAGQATQDNFRQSGAAGVGAVSAGSPAGKTVTDLNSLSAAAQSSKARSEAVAAPYRTMVQAYFER